MVWHPAPFRDGGLLDASVAQTSWQQRNSGGGPSTIEAVSASWRDYGAPTFDHRNPVVHPDGSALDRVGGVLAQDIVDHCNDLAGTISRPVFVDVDEHPGVLLVYGSEVLPVVREQEVAVVATPREQLLVDSSYSEPLGRSFHAVVVRTERRGEDPRHVLVSSTHRSCTMPPRSPRSGEAAGRHRSRVVDSGTPRNRTVTRGNQPENDCNFSSSEPPGAVREPAVYSRPPNGEYTRRNLEYARKSGVEPHSIRLRSGRRPEQRSVKTDVRTAHPAERRTSAGESLQRSVDPASSAVLLPEPGG